MHGWDREHWLESSYHHPLPLSSTTETVCCCLCAIYDPGSQDPIHGGIVIITLMVILKKAEEV